MLERPPWIIPSPYRTMPLPILPILPPLKRKPMPVYSRMKKMKPKSENNDDTTNG